MAPKVVSKQLPKADDGVIGSAVMPVSGKYYEVINLANSRYLDNAHYNTDDGNPITAWEPNDPKPHTSKQIWKFLTYPSGKDETITVFTLQVRSTIESNSSAVIDGRGGYMRADPINKTLVHGGQPQAWKLIEVTNEGANIFMMSPFENAFSDNGKLFATDNSPNLDPNPDAPSANQVKLLSENSVEYKIEQLWVFHDVE